MYLQPTLGIKDFAYKDTCSTFTCSRKGRHFVPQLGCRLGMKGGGESNLERGWSKFLIFFKITSFHTHTLFLSFSLASTAMYHARHKINYWYPFLLFLVTSVSGIIEMTQIIYRWGQEACKAFVVRQYLKGLTPCQSYKIWPYAFPGSWTRNHLYEIWP